MSSDGVFVTPPPPPKSERSVAALLADLVNQISLLVRQEMALFRTELTEKIGLAGRGAAAIAVGAVFALGGFLAIIATAALALVLVLPPWLSALIVGIICLAIAAALVLYGKSRLEAEKLKPRHTLHSLQEDRIWLREQAR
ncbi:MAG TPA: phage holin family protein [Stellaceae bacterium]|nr:phage holin family protein [Stellaceae bacterium]